MTELVEIFEFFRQCVEPRDLFGDVDNPGQLKKIYREWARKVHEDLYKEESQKIIARKIFQKLGELYTSGLNQLRNNHYGKILIENGKYKYYVDRIISGDISNVHVSSCGLLKIAKNIKLNRFILNERSILKKFNKIEDKKLCDLLRSHTPKLINHFSINDLEVNVVDLYEKKVYTLEEVKNKYPGGIDGRTMAWIFRRMLSAAGTSHYCGHIHGGIIPSNFLICPDDHNGILIDWCYSVKNGEKITSITPTKKLFYAPEILLKRPVSPSADIYSIAVCMIYICGGDIKKHVFPNHIPKEIQNFIKSCLIHSPSWRPADAFRVHFEFGDLLLRVYGKPKFHAFTM